MTENCTNKNTPPPSRFGRRSRSWVAPLGLFGFQAAGPMGRARALWGAPRRAHGSLAVRTVGLPRNLCRTAPEASAGLPQRPLQDCPKRRAPLLPPPPPCPAGLKPRMPLRGSFVRRGPSVRPSRRWGPSAAGPRGGSPAAGPLRNSLSSAISLGSARLQLAPAAGSPRRAPPRVRTLKGSTL